MQKNGSQQELKEIIASWEGRRPPATEQSAPRQAFSTDLSERSRFDTLARYIMHYTDPGDIVLQVRNQDGSAGVSGALCGEREFLEYLNYQVDESGVVSREKVIYSPPQVELDNADDLELDELFDRAVNAEFERQKQEVREWQPFSRLGTRNVIMHGSSSMAAIKGQSYFQPTTREAFIERLDTWIGELEARYSALYCVGEGGVMSEWTWSVVLECSSCQGEVPYAEHEWKGEGASGGDYECPHCKHREHQSKAKRSRRYPVSISYLEQGKRLEKAPDAEDLRLLEDARQQLQLRLESGESVPAETASGQFYTDRALLVLMTFRDHLLSSPDNARLARVFAAVMQSSAMDMMSPTHKEKNVLQVLQAELRTELKNDPFLSGETVTLCAAKDDFSLCPDNSVDYIVVSPPDNRFRRLKQNHVERWLGLDAETPGEQHTRDDWEPMLAELFRVLKPGKWMTMMFSNRMDFRYDQQRLNGLFNKNGFELVSNEVSDPPRKGVAVMMSHDSCVLTARKHETV